MGTPSPEQIIERLRVRLQLAESQVKELSRDAAKRDQYVRMAQTTLERFIKAGQDLFRKANNCYCCHCGAIDSIKRVMNPANRDPKTLGGMNGVAAPGRE
jgi:hypothetical protein